MQTIEVECWACGHEQKAIPDKDSVSPILWDFFLVGKTEDLDCPKCGLPTLEEKRA